MMETFPPLLLVGAGRMGGALLAGWRAAGLAPSVIVDPVAAIARAEDRVVPSLAEMPAEFRPEAVVLCIKPQKAPEILPVLRRVLPSGTPILSVMAGIRATTIAQALAGPVVRAMPNTPAAIGRAITACYAAPDVSEGQCNIAERLMRAVGETVWVSDEALIDVATAISGSGPAYVFLLAELLQQAGTAQGLPPEAARALARATVSGAGALLAAADEDAAELRRQVTSPGGTTERALAVLMQAQAWPRAVADAVQAGVDRARELAG